MRLYLMQHGEAVDKEIDTQRPLSERGKRDVERVSIFLAAAGIQIPTIWHSTKTRARETAEILSTFMHVNTVEQTGLNPDDDITAVLHALCETEDDLAIVGHLPHLALLAAELLRTKGKSTPVFFQRGGIVALHRNGDKTWQVAWMIVPELLKK